jgi:hypothetical protein
MSEEKHPGGFTVVDRRGEAKPERVDPAVNTKNEDGETVPGKVWKDVAYMCVMSQAPGGGLMALGRAVGLREDLRTFVADFVLPPIWHEKLDWCPTAKKRLDTFLGCKCTMSGPCEVHRVELGKWFQQDTDRLNLLAAQPIPEAIEYLIKLEENLRNNRVVPVAAQQVQKQRPPRHRR